MNQPIHSLPIVSSGGRRMGWFWFVAPAVLVAYGSLIPFRFDFSVLEAGDGFRAMSPAWHATSWEDAITNVLVYVPIGFGFLLAWRQSATKRRRLVPCALALSVVISAAVEWCQTVVVGRVASWTDVVLNGLGATVGAAVAAAFLGTGRALLSRVRLAFARRPCSTLAGGLTLGLLVYHLAPFDLITDTARLQDSFRRAQWLPSTSAEAGGPEAALGCLPTRLVGTLWFAALGYFAALGRRERGESFRAAFRGTLHDGWLIVLLIEGLQLFFRSHSVTGVMVLLHGLAVTLGAWVGVHLVDRQTRSIWRQRRRLAVPSLLLGVVLALQLVNVLGGSPRPAGWIPDGFAWMGVHWIPFEALWRRPMVPAAMDALGTALTYGTLGLCLAIALRRMRLQAVWPVVTALLALSAVAAEGLRGMSVSGTPDATLPLLAALSALPASSLDAWLLRSPPVVRLNRNS